MIEYLIPVVVLSLVVVVFVQLVRAMNEPGVHNRVPTGTIVARGPRDRESMKKKSSPVVIDSPVFMGYTDDDPYAGLGPVLKAISRAEDRYIKALQEKPLVRKSECAYCGQTVDKDTNLCPRCGGDTHG